MSSLFTEHPASVGESYGEHLGTAVSFGSRMIAAGLACMVHAVLPFLFQRTGSTAIATLHERMIANRVKQAPVVVLSRLDLGRAKADS